MQQSWQQQSGSTSLQWNALPSLSGEEESQQQQQPQQQLLGPREQQVREGRDALVAFLKQEFGKADVRAAFLAIKVSWPAVSLVLYLGGTVVCGCAF